MNRLRRTWRRLEAFLQAYYEAPFRRELARRRRAREDVLRLLVFSEALGVDNPLAWHLLELRPLLADEFHDWHRRMGLDHSPLDCPRCC